MELEFLKFLAERVPRGERVDLGVGDDAAILSWPANERLVVCTDMICDGTDFMLAQCGAEAVGRKALAVNLSDLAAMAAKPVAALCSMHLPRQNAAEIARGVTEGILNIANEFNVAIVGGDTGVWDHPLVVNVTLLGERPPGDSWRRDGAQVGDRILVTGDLGGSISGKHLSFTPRVREALAIREIIRVNACIDISDGFSIDLHRICAASNVGAKIIAAHIPISAAAKSQPNKPAIQSAIEDGEDFELLMCVRPADAAALMADSRFANFLIDVGEITQATDLVLQQGEDTKTLPPLGYTH